jgi:hypothetical protein
MQPMCDGASVDRPYVQRGCTPFAVSIKTTFGFAFFRRRRCKRRRRGCDDSTGSQETVAADHRRQDETSPGQEKEEGNQVDAASANRCSGFEVRWSRDVPSGARNNARRRNMTEYLAFERSAEIGKKSVFFCCCCCRCLAKPFDQNFWLHGAVATCEISAT